MKSKINSLGIRQAEEEKQDEDSVMKQCILQ